VCLDIHSDIFRANGFPGYWVFQQEGAFTFVQDGSELSVIDYRSLTVLLLSLQTIASVT
jgi:hypothetical protein